MDDSCAVCAEPLEWVAYGSCGHREVCSTCVVRLRFVLDDRRCCICKIESPTVFVTKALGDYTRVITDFSRFLPGANEGRVGEYWYHEDSQAYFDDVDHFRMIQAMCRLSCSVCDGTNGEHGGGDSSRRRATFKNIEQLKGHLFHQHKLFMCSLCLEGRKIFISEQRLYTRTQLSRHISTGDSEVDGSETERGGFTGHPMCEFCKNPFYGDNELYMHMSRDHFTCHICQRQHPGQYDYFKNYDDLEIHFRQEHFLCEDEACLAEKFIVFQSESELKRHNTIKHGGNMSRSKRNAALQIPTSFRYRQSSAQAHRRGRGRGFRFDPSNDHLAMAIQASIETAETNGRAHDPSHVREGSEHGEIASSIQSLNINHNSGPPSSTVTRMGQSSSRPILEESAFPALSDREPPEPSSRYAQALSIAGGRASLRQESFPPLPGSSGNVIQEPTKQTVSTFAGRVGKSRIQSKSVPRAAQLESARNSDSKTSTSMSLSHSQSTSFGSVTSSGTGLSYNLATSQGRSAKTNRFASPGQISNPWNSSNTNRLSHSSSDPDLVGRESLNNVASNISVIHKTRNRDLLSGSHSLSAVADVHTANKSLIEKIHTGLEMDDDKFAAFKAISAEYRQNLISTVEYISYVQQFGLSHLIVELARLCPDPKKQRELIDTYNANMRHQYSKENGGTTTSSKESHSSSKKKGKCLELSENHNSKDALADRILDTVKKLQASQKPQEEKVELLSKDGYRTAKNKLTLPNREDQGDSRSVAPVLNMNGDDQNTGAGNSKQKRKTSKFNRVRLGDGSVAALWDVDRANNSPEHNEEKSSSNQVGVSVRGVWRNGGGQKLFGPPAGNPH